MTLCSCQKLALLSAVRAEFRAIKARQTELYRCRDCFHIGPAADHDWMWELRDGKLVDVYGPLCECGSGEIWPVGAGER